MSEEVEKALEIAARYSGFDGAHHKSWVIDQMVRALTGSPMVTKHATDVNGIAYSYEAQDDGPEYMEFVRQFEAGEGGPQTYLWDIGIAP